MPRLINEDAYIDKVCTYKTTGCGSCKFQTVCPADEPTVEAIPIEWIKEWVERDENYWDYQYLTDVLLKDWEKDNASITD